MNTALPSLVVAVIACFLNGCLSRPDKFEWIGNGTPIPSVSVGNRTYEITSDPSGADIYFHGELIGKTPLVWKRYVLIPTFEITDFEARLNNREKGYLAGKSLALSSKTTTQINGSATNWQAYTTQLHFSLPLLPELIIENDWNEATSANSEQGYHHFLSLHPDTKYSTDAKQRIAELKKQTDEFNKQAEEKRRQDNIAQWEKVKITGLLPEQEFIECCAEFVKACHPICSYNIKIVSYSKNSVIVHIICRNRDVALFGEASTIGLTTASGLIGIFEGIGSIPKTFEVRILTMEQKLVGSAYYSDILKRAKWVSGFKK